MQGDFIPHFECADEDEPLPEEPAEILVIGQYLDPIKGIEAFILSVDGDTGRPDGGVYYLAWSTTKGKWPFDIEKAIEDGYLLFPPEKRYRINASPAAMELVH